MFELCIGEGENGGRDLHSKSTTATMLTYSCTLDDMHLKNIVYSTLATCVYIYLFVFHAFIFFLFLIVLLRLLLWQEINYDSPRGGVSVAQYINICIFIN